MTNFVGGDGSEATPFLIADADGLWEIGVSDGLHYALVADINLNYLRAGSGQPFISIANGSLDGRGHTLYGYMQNGTDLGFVNAIAGSLFRRLHVDTDAREVFGGSAGGGGIFRLSRDTVMEDLLVTGGLRGTGTASVGAFGYANSSGAPVDMLRCVAGMFGTSPPGNNSGFLNTNATGGVAPIVTFTDCYSFGDVDSLPAAVTWVNTTNIPLEASYPALDFSPTGAWRMTPLGPRLRKASATIQLEGFGAENIETGEAAQFVAMMNVASRIIDQVVPVAPDGTWVMTLSPGTYFRIVWSEGCKPRIDGRYTVE